MERYLIEILARDVAGWRSNQVTVLIAPDYRFRQTGQRVGVAVPGHPPGKTSVPQSRACPIDFVKPGGRPRRDARTRYLERPRPQGLCLAEKDNCEGGKS